jgi:hypothetical protein
MNNIDSNDEYLLNKLSNHIDNLFQKKINLIYLLLRSNLSLQINSVISLKKFFIFLSPLNTEFLLSSRIWNHKIINHDNNHYILFQNSISKKDCCTFFYKHYIDLVKNALFNSGIQYNYFEFKCKRFNKIKDIIWSFNLNQFN